MKKCGKECYPLCDFCKHYSFNGEDIEIVDQCGRKKVVKGGCYTGNGFCNLHKRQEDPENQCEDFHCESTTLKGKWRMFCFRLSQRIIFDDLSIGKQKGFKLQVGWIHVKILFLGKKFLMEFSLAN